MSVAVGRSPAEATVHDVPICPFRFLSRGVSYPDAQADQRHHHQRSYDSYAAHDRLFYRVIPREEEPFRFSNPLERNHLLHVLQTWLSD